MSDSITVLCTDDAEKLCRFPSVIIPEHWATLSADQLLASVADLSTPFVALTGTVPAGERLDWLSGIVENGTESLADSVLIAADPIPESLRPSFTGPLGILARPPQRDDLVVVRTDLFRDLSGLYGKAATGVFAAISANPSVTIASGTGDPDLSVLPELGPGTPRKAFRFLRRGLPTGVLSSEASAYQRGCVLSGLLLIHDDLDHSHQQSQQFEGLGRDRTADYWHGLMHRREPDFGNAGYWFRKVGQHDAFASLSETLRSLDWSGFSAATQNDIDRLIRGPWDAFAMIDFCRQAIGETGSEVEHAARLIQYTEMLNLLIHCTTQL